MRATQIAIGKLYRNRHGGVGKCVGRQGSVVSVETVFPIRLGVITWAAREVERELDHGDIQDLEAHASKMERLRKLQAEIDE